jgi:hypothetical protein
MYLSEVIDDKLGLISEKAAFCRPTFYRFIKEKGE